MTLRIRRRFHQDNDVTLFRGNCLRLLRAIPDQSAQLVITSPPYNVGKEYEGTQTVDEYLAFQRLVIGECVRITRPGGSLCWQVGHHVNGHQQVIPLDILLHPLFAAHEACRGVRLRNRIIWHFEHGLNCRYRLSGRHETILWYTLGDDYTFELDAIRVRQKYPGKLAYKGKHRGQYSCNPLGKNPGDVWIIPNVKAQHVEKTEHPCQFPFELPERLILVLSKKGDLVVDPFLGVGTTAAAAVLHRRKAAGADPVSRYMDIAEERVRQAHAGLLPRRPLRQPVYTPPPGTRLTTVPAEFLAKRNSHRPDPS